MRLDVVYCPEIDVYIDSLTSGMVYIARRIVVSELVLEIFASLDIYNVRALMHRSLMDSVNMSADKRYSLYCNRTVLARLTAEVV